MNNKLKIGIGSYTFTWSVGVPGYDNKNSFSAFDLIEKALELKAEVVQFADNMPLENYSRDELVRLLSFAEEKLITIEVGAKGLTLERLEMYIEIACFLHADTLRFIIDGNDYEPSFDTIIKVIRPCIPLLQKTRVRLALENHDRLTCAEFSSIVEACNSPFVGICLDTVNSLGIPEGTEEVINTLSPFTLNLHVKDFSIGRLDHKMGFKVEGTPAGEGKLDITGLFGKLSVKGKCSSAILELWTPFGPTLEDTIARENEWARRSMQYLRQLSY
ncbi:MAG: TIM barrel protein [Proteiniphilum sp.]